MPNKSWHRTMQARDSSESHRVATPLELLFDLCFVVAIALASSLLHHAISTGNTGYGVGAFLMVFFGIWWAWMNFTWFASAYDTDDVPYRLTTLLQIAGVLVLAAGVEQSFEHGDLRVVTLGYVIMRIALVTQWLRAAYAEQEGRRTARRMAFGVAACMVGWGLLLLVHGWAHLPLFLVMVALELTVPLLAERRYNTPWHPHHIAERYGLMFIIVLGEIILSTTLAVQAGLRTVGAAGSLLWVALSGLVIVFALWWLYFDQPTHRLLENGNHRAFVWGYGHYIVFASATAVGAGIAVVVDYATGVANGSRPAASAAVTIPVAVLLLALWFLQVRPHHGPRHWLFPAAALLILGATFVRPGLLVTAGVMAALVTGWVTLGVWVAPARTSRLARDRQHSG